MHYPISNAQTPKHAGFLESPVRTRNETSSSLPAASPSLPQSAAYIRACLRASSSGTLKPFHVPNLESTPSTGTHSVAPANTYAQHMGPATFGNHHPVFPQMRNLSSVMQFAMVIQAPMSVMNLPPTTAHRTSTTFPAIIGHVQSETASPMNSDNGAADNSSEICCVRQHRIHPSLPSSRVRYMC